MWTQISYLNTWDDRIQNTTLLNAPIFAENSENTPIMPPPQLGSVLLQNGGFLLNEDGGLVLLG